LHGTGFAGSQYSLAMLTAWALLTHILAINGIGADVVAADASIRYKSPVSTDIVCKSSVEQSEVAGLMSALDRKGRGRLQVNVAVNDAATMQANMVAILK
jgi:thioesterase domain-containing protein